MDEEFVRVVTEDLLWLRNEWNDAMDKGSLRRGSSTLRGLVDYSWMYRVRNELGIGDVEMRVIAPYIEPCLRGENKRNIKFLVGGGGTHGGVDMCLMGLNTGSEVFGVEGDMELDDVVDFEFRLQSYFDSAAIYVGGYTVSRREVVQYVANKLGAAHYDKDRDDKPAYQILDSHRNRLSVEGQGVDKLDLVYFELLSIGQIIGRSDAAKRLIRAADEVGVVDL